MPNIKISELSPSGTDLFSDSESFLNELKNDGMESVIGGRINISINSNVSIIANTVITANANTINANTIGNVNSKIG